MNHEKLRKILQEAVEEGLSVLGESGKRATMFHMKNTFEIKIEDASFNIKEFTDALRVIFGPGAIFLEQIILEKLCNKIGLKKAADLSLEEAVEKLSNLKGE